MEIVKEILSDKVDYLNALRNAPQLPVAPPIIIEVVESVVPAIPKPKKGFKAWHLLAGIVVFGIAVYAIKKYKAKKEKEQEYFNGWR